MDTSRSGQTWTAKEEGWMLMMIDRGHAPEEVAQHFQRTVGAIKSRQRHIAVRLVRGERTVEQAARASRLTVEEVEEALAQCNIAVTPPPPETLMSVMREVRDLLRVIAEKL